MYWVNSQFQILAFIVGKCYTFDEAYRVCRQEMESRERAIYTTQQEHNIAGLLMEPENDLDPVRRNLVNCYKAALDERDFYRLLIERIQPHRKYANLPDNEAFQKCQREEWALRLQDRATNYLFSQGYIPADHFEAMRLHPDFDAIIAPTIEKLRLEFKKNDGVLSIPKRQTTLLLELN